MKHVMDVKASDNKYLHRDFHVSGDVGVNYVGTKYGDNGVREYLTTFATRFYSPLVEDMKNRGLVAMEEHIKKIYEIEEAADAVKTELTDGELKVCVSYCPGVRHMLSTGHTPSKWYKNLTSTVNETIADNADVGFEMISYDDATGAACYRFFKRAF